MSATEISIYQAILVTTMNVTCSIYFYLLGRSKGRREAFEKGYEKGYTEGRDDGYSSGYGKGYDTAYKEREG